MSSQLVVLAALLALSTALVLPIKKAVQKPDAITDHFVCLLCQDVAKDTEKWVGDEESSAEQQQIAQCEQFLGGANTALAKSVCDYFVKNSLDDLIKHLESTDTEGQDALEICKGASLCPQ